MKFARRFTRGRRVKRCLCGRPMYHAANEKEFCNRCSPGKPLPLEMLSQYRKVRA